MHKKHFLTYLSIYILSSAILTGCTIIFNNIEIGFKTPAGVTQAVETQLPPTQPSPTQDPASQTSYPKETTSEPIEPTEPTAASTGDVEGRVCFPSEYIPTMTIYFKDSSTGKVFTTEIAENQAQFQTKLPVGTYVAFAYPNKMGFGGMYSAAVPCGLTITCTDHSLLPIQVQANQLVDGVDICDWYAPEDVPARPTDSQPAENMHYPHSLPVSERAGPSCVMGYDTNLTAQRNPS